MDPGPDLDPAPLRVLLLEDEVTLARAVAAANPRTGKRLPAATQSVLGRSPGERASVGISNQAHRTHPRWHMTDRDRGRMIATRVTVGLGAAGMLGVAVFAVAAQATDAAGAGTTDSAVTGDSASQGSIGGVPPDGSTGVTSGDGAQGSDAGSGGS